MFKQTYSSALTEILLATLLSACSFGAAPTPEDKKSFSCDDEQIICIVTKETCVPNKDKRKCNTSVDVTCNSRGDESGELIWKTENARIGNTKITITCQTNRQ